MSTAKKIIVNEACLNQLAEPFPAKEIEWRVQRAGVNRNNTPWVIVVPYVTARGIQRRLDEIVGPANWQTEMASAPGGMLCSLKIRVDNEWVTKSDGAEGDSQMDGMDKIKAACSRALVRAAVHWGMGRYLYDAPTCFGQIVPYQDDAYRVVIDGKEFFWLPPSSVIPKKPEPQTYTDLSMLESRRPLAQAQTEVPAVISTPPVKPKVDPKRPVKIVVPQNAPGLGDMLVPFGHNQNIPIKDLDEADIRGLLTFYKKKPTGQKAKDFKPLFFTYLDSIGFQYNEE